MRKETRKQQILKRKNFFPTLIITILLWLSLGVLIYFVEPEFFGAIPLFFVLVFMVSLFSFSLIFASRNRGFISAVSTTLFLLLAYFGVGNPINLVLIISIAFAIDLYFSYK